jgi:hypothetical protein
VHGGIGAFDAHVALEVTDDVVELLHCGGILTAIAVEAARQAR